MNQTPLGKEELKRTSQIIQQLFDSPDSLEFRQPVDVKGLGLEDYYELIKQPMDLGTVSRKLQQGKYKTVEEVLDDIQLVWDNCKTYNAYGSWIWKLADKLEKLFKKYVKNYLPLVNVPQPSIKIIFNMIKEREMNKPKEQNLNKYIKDNIYTEEQNDVISYNDKVEFSNNLKLLQPDQIGLIVHMIQNGCPNAFVEVDKERYQLVVDNIDSDIFSKCTKQVEMWLSGEQSIKKLKV